ncbi:hypothetical protein [Pectinatus frisingensis]|uniref:hypothetical protein n=1 Tax=Pectinatus frisingensis TaxID=865 RepID=UPI0018C5B19B|nr:hypothetical protein [Pectinatus frisingensis]
MPDQFENLQPHEFYKLIDGYEVREKENDFKRAYFTSWLIAPHLKEPVTVQQIMKPLHESREDQLKKAAEDRTILLKEFGLREPERK